MRARLRPLAGGIQHCGKGAGRTRLLPHLRAVLLGGVVLAALLFGSLLIPGVAKASPQTVTFLGAYTGNGSSINTGPYNNYAPVLTFPDPNTEWTQDGGATWHQAYDVGIHPWGEVPGTDSWIDCGPALTYCVNQTTTYRVRFTVPADWSNPMMKLTFAVDNIGSVTLNGSSIIDNYTGGPGGKTATVTPPLQTGVNELLFVVTDVGGITGFNYRADMNIDAPAPPGVVAPGTPDPIGCQPGTYSSTGAAPCTDAPAGMYVPTAWAASPTPCPAGTFSETSGSTACTPAPAGSYVAALGSSSAMPCAPGTFEPSLGSSACEPAAPGFYVSESGSTSAAPCSVGMFSADAGSTACTPAPVGYFVSSPGSSSATPAPADFYVDVLGAAAPVACPPGTTTNGLTAQTACVAIPPTITLQSISPAPNGAGWNDGPVTVTWVCTYSQSATVSVVLSSDGANQSATGTCVGGIDPSLTASDTQTGISIDQTPPVLAPSVSSTAVGLAGVETVVPNASDALSGIDTASCGSADTSTLGTQSVTCTATDLAGNSATATVSYDVTAIATKQAILAQIQAALATASGHDREALRQAARALTDSLDPRLWADPNHPTAQGGKRVFEDEKQAVEALSEGGHDHRSSLDAATVQGWIGGLVAVDRALASVGIGDASGGDARKLAEARKELAKGDAEAGNGRSNAAIEHYGNAWQQAEQAVVSHAPNGHGSDGGDNGKSGGKSGHDR